MPDPQHADHDRNFSGITTGVTLIRKIFLLGFFVLMYGAISLQPISLHAQSSSSEKTPIFILPGTPIPVELSEAFLSNESNVEQTLELLDRLEKDLLRQSFQVVKDFKKHLSLRYRLGLGL